MKKHVGQKITRGMHRGFTTMTQAVLLALLMLGTGIALQASDRQLGDIFVAIGNGSYQVYHNNVLTTDTITDTAGGGNTAGCAFDSTYHAFTTNVTNNDVFRHRIDDPQTAFQTISVLGAGGGQPTSVAFDSLGNSYVGNAAGNGLIEEYDATGTIVQTLPVKTKKLKGGSAWIDLSPNAQTFYFTNGTKNINQFGVSSSTVTVFASISGTTFFAIRVLTPDAQAATASLIGGPGFLLAAAGPTIQLFNSSGISIMTYTALNESNFQVLTLDPDGASFWAGSPTSHNFYRFALTAATPNLTINTGAGGPSGLCAYGAFSAAQPQPITVSTTTSLSSACPTLDVQISAGPIVTVVSPNATCTVPSPCTTTGTCNEFTSTLFGLNTDVTATLQYLQIAPAAGASDTGLPCLKSSLDVPPTKCEVFSLSLGLSGNLASFFPQHDLALFSIQPTSVPIPAAYTNPVALENEVNDITDFVFHGSTRTGGSCVNPPCNSTFTVHEQPLQTSATGSTSCGYTSPLPGQSFNQGRVIPFKFTAVAPPNTCPNGPNFLTNLTPELVIVQLNNLPNANDAPHAVLGDVAGGSGTPLFYRLSAPQWILNVDTSSLLGCALNGVPTSCSAGGVPTQYLATTFDATQVNGLPAPLIPSFNFFDTGPSAVTFQLQ